MNLADLERIIGKTTSLPTLPAIIAQILQTLNHPESSAHDAAEIVKKDLTLVASLLRLVNSASYGLGRKVSSVGEAISLLGFSTVINLSLSSAVLDAFKLKHFDVTDVWRHAITTSIAAQFFASKTGDNRHPGMASSLGLVHDIGKLLFMMEMPLDYQDVLEAEKSSLHTLAIEKDILNVDHCQAGMLLARHWGWPTVYQDAILHHHSPHRSRVDPVLTLTVYLGSFAEHVISDEAYAEIRFEHVLEPLQSKAELAEKFTESDWQECLEFLATQQDEIQKFLQSIR